MQFMHTMAAICKICTGDYSRYHDHDSGPGGLRDAWTGPGPKSGPGPTPPGRAGTPTRGRIIRQLRARGQRVDGTAQPGPGPVQWRPGKMKRALKTRDQNLENDLIGGSELQSCADDKRVIPWDASHA